MKLDEIKKLSKKEFAERYPFVQMRTWPKGELAFDDETGEPTLEFYVDNWAGWNDILLCWAEKVKPVYDKLPKDIQDQFYISQLKEKYGDMRLYTSINIDDIDYYTRMVEHLSTFTCYQCGHLGKSSNGKKLIIWRTRGYWVSYMCKKCARKFMFKDIQHYGRKPGWTNKMIFDQEWSREEGDWFSRWTSYKDGKKETKAYDCRELLEGMY